jgi:hypothetical protein
VTATVPPPRTALVIFVDHAPCRWLRGLQRGFRHCFVVIRDADDWLVCDPLKDRIELSLLRLPAAFDLAGFYLGRGHRVMVGRTAPTVPRRPLAPALLTCVGVAKRVLGLRAPGIITPWQLWRHLDHEGEGWQPAQVHSSSGCPRDRHPVHDPRAVTVPD